MAPLEGIRVIDMTSVVFGPTATQALADWGADVVKVEPPEGDTLRHAGVARHRGMSAMFLNLNRGKRSVALDVATPAGLDAMRRLLAGADLFVHNVRREPIARLGLGPDAVRAIAPSIVYCTASGWHERSPLARAPAIDDSIQAATGLAALNAGPDGAPRFVPSVIADKTAGLALAGAMLAALVRRLRTGVGGTLDVPMYDTLAGFVLAEHLQGRTFEPSDGPAGYRRVTPEGRRMYRAKDGWLTMTPYTRPQWKAFFEAVGDAAMADDPRVVDPVERNRHVQWLYGRVGEAAAARNVDEWLVLCREHGIPASRAVPLDEVARDPGLEASGAIARVEHPTEGTVRMLSSPGFIDGAPSRAPGPAPRLGEHTVAVLREAGLDDTAIGAMLASGVALAAPPADTAPPAA